MNIKKPHYIAEQQRLSKRNKEISKEIVDCLGREQLIPKELYWEANSNIRRIKFLMSYSPDVIVEYFLSYYTITRQELLSGDQFAKIVSIKRWISFFSYKTGDYTYKQIAEKLGYTNKSSILSHISTLEDQLFVDKKLLEEFKIHLTNLQELFIMFVGIKENYGKSENQNQSS
jgi:chromosomal replication initiation ATPase DnaA